MARSATAFSSSVLFITLSASFLMPMVEVGGLKLEAAEVHRHQDEGDEGDCGDECGDGGEGGGGGAESPVGHQCDSGTCGTECVGHKWEYTLCGFHRTGNIDGVYVGIDDGFGGRLKPRDWGVQGSRTCSAGQAWSEGDDGCATADSDGQTSHRRRRIPASDHQYEHGRTFAQDSAFTDGTHRAEHFKVTQDPGNSYYNASYNAYNYQYGVGDKPWTLAGSHPDYLTPANFARRVPREDLLWRAAYDTMAESRSNGASGYLHAGALGLKGPYSVVDGKLVYLHHQAGNDAEVAYANNDAYGTLESEYNAFNGERNNHSKWKAGDMHVPYTAADRARMRGLLDKYLKRKGYGDAEAACFLANTASANNFKLEETPVFSQVTSRTFPGNDKTPVSFGHWIERACGYGAEITNAKKYGGLSTRFMVDELNNGPNPWRAGSGGMDPRDFVAAGLLNGDFPSDCTDGVFRNQSLNERGQEGEFLNMDRYQRYCIDKTTMELPALWLAEAPYWDGTPRASAENCELWGAEDLGLDPAFYQAIASDASDAFQYVEGTAHEQGPMILMDTSKALGTAKLCLPKDALGAQCKRVSGAPLVPETLGVTQDIFGNQLWKDPPAIPYRCPAYTLNQQCTDRIHYGTTKAYAAKTTFLTLNEKLCSVVKGKPELRNQLAGNWQDCETYTLATGESWPDAVADYKCTMQDTNTPENTGKPSPYCKLKSGTGCKPYSNKNVPDGTTCKYTRQVYEENCRATAGCKWEPNMGCASTGQIEDLKELMCKLGEDMPYWTYMKGLHQAFVEFAKALGAKETGKGYIIGDCNTAAGHYKRWDEALYDLVGIAENTLAKIPLVGPALVILGRILVLVNGGLDSKASPGFARLFIDLPNFSFRQTVETISFQQTVETVQTGGDTLSQMSKDAVQTVEENLVYAAVAPVIGAGVALMR